MNHTTICPITLIVAAVPVSTHAKIRPLQITMDQVALRHFGIATARFPLRALPDGRRNASGPVFKSDGCSRAELAGIVNCS